MEGQVERTGKRELGKIEVRGEKMEERRREVPRVKGGDRRKN